MTEKVNYKGFRNALRRENMRKSTIDQYVNLLRKLPQELVSKDRLGDLNNYLKRKFKVSSRTIIIAAIRAYFKYYLNDKEAADGLESTGWRSSETQYFLEPSEIKRLLEVCENEFENLLVTIFLETGLRRSCLLEIKKQDISRKFIRIDKNYKGNKSKRDYNAGISDETYKRILKFCEENGITKGQRIFYEYVKDYGHRQIEDVADKLTYIIMDIGKRMGKPKLTPHKLRHVAGTYQYEAEKDLLKTMKMLGHTTPKSSMRYINTPETIRASLEKRKEKMGLK